MKPERGGRRALAPNILATARDSSIVGEKRKRKERKEGKGRGAKKGKKRTAEEEGRHKGRKIKENQTTRDTGEKKNGKGGVAQLGFPIEIMVEPTRDGPAKVAGLHRKATSADPPANIHMRKDGGKKGKKAFFF